VNMVTNRGHVRDLYVGGRIVLKSALHELCVVLWTGLDWTNVA